MLCMVPVPAEVVEQEKQEPVCCHASQARASVVTSSLGQASNRGALIQQQALPVTMHPSPARERM